jgi:hypothetical protein
VCGWPVEIKAGEETRLEVTIPQGVKRAVRFAPLSEPTPTQLTMRWRGASGQVVSEMAFTWDKAEMPGRDMWFAPGSWELEVVAGSGRSAKTTVVIPDLTPTAEEILLRLP